MTEPTEPTEPTAADLDAMLRRAHGRGAIAAMPDDEAPPEPAPPRPAPLPGGGAAPSTGVGEIDGDKWLRARIDSQRHGLPMPPVYRLTKDA